MEGRAPGADVRGDTIAAVATAPGRAALAVVRLSGPEAATIASRISRPWPLQERRATRVFLHRPGTQDSLDEAMATMFLAPRSFTGETVVEFSVHGGAYVSTAVLAALVEAGARPALPGEFSERAVRNGKMDLLQAEAIADVIEARTRAMHRTALRQLGGALSRRLSALRESLLEVEALIAYEIDFPEEDDGPQPRVRVVAAGERVLREIAALLGTIPGAELGRDGVTVVLAGAPNVGKSSLFNVLAGDARAIVSEQPGTTRDAIEVLVDDDPWPLRLVDTAGLRDSADAVERLGIEVSLRRLAAAHAVLVCADSDDALAAACGRVAAVSRAPRIAVRTKLDLCEGPVGWRAPSELDAAGAIAVSAVSGSGIPELRALVREVVRTAEPEPPEELPHVTRARHAAALSAARAEVETFINAWSAGVLPPPVAATHLRAAVYALDELIGGIDVDEVLARVFRSFCVGK